MSFDQLSNVEAGGGGSSRRSGGGSGGYSDSPEFSRVSQNLMNQLFHLQGNNAKLRTEINRLGTRQDNPRLRERVQSLLEESRDKFKEVGEGVKKLQGWPAEEVTPTQRYSQQKLARELGAGLKDFQGLQRTAVEKLSASVNAAKAALESPTGGDQGELQFLQQQEQQQDQVHLAAQDEVDFQDALISEREEEIRQIEEGVGDLNVLFRQVAQIVTEQGEQLETIEGNAISVRDDTRGADYELRAAARYQRNARSKACCLLLILAVILTIVMLAVFLG
ncbi:t-SNARE [Xylariales sp. PMI_506]|nr:t-SNARE [Xylariales sp. PMI_506]